MTVVLIPGQVDASITPTGWQLFAAPDGSGLTAPAAADPDVQRVTGNAGTRLVTRLDPPVQGDAVVLRAELLVTSGRLLLAAAMNTDTSESVLIGAGEQWQQVNQPLTGPVNQVVLYLMDPGTDVSVRGVSCRRPEPATPRVLAQEAPGSTALGQLPAVKAQAVDDVHANRPPSVHFGPEAAPGRVGQAHTLAGRLDPGVVWSRSSDTGVNGKPVLTWSDDPVVTYTGVSAAADGAQVVSASAAGDSFTVVVTANDTAAHVVTLTASTQEGRTFTAQTTFQPVSISASMPASVPLSDSGSLVPVTATVAPASWYPAATPSRVKAKADSGSEAFLTCAADGITWTGTVMVSGQPLGARSVTVTATDLAGGTIATVVTFTATDNTPPTTTLPRSAAKAADGAVHITGQTTDRQAGVVGGKASVAIRVLPSGPDADITPRSAGDWSEWTASFVPVKEGPTTLQVTASDANGATGTALHDFDIVSGAPLRLADRLSPPAYLRALMAFARDFVSTAAAPMVPVTTADLDAALAQSLEAMSQPLTPQAHAAQVSVNELRVPVELLRSSIADGSVDTSAGAAGENAYRLTAYESLLVAAGTSYDELRLVRSAEPATRIALAARLGIPLYGPTGATPRPDQLDALTLAPDAVTEVELETLFGLADTTAADRLREPKPGRLQLWRTEILRTQWRQQDKTPSAPLAYSALVDPDLISVADVLASSPAAVPLTALLVQRQADLDAIAAAISKATNGGVDTRAALTAAFTASRPDAAATWFDEIVAAEAAGTDIADLLSTAGLDRPQYAYLVQLEQLTATGMVTGEEWSDVRDILVSAYRQRQQATWIEGENDVVLAPDLFIDSGSAPARPTWRARAQARQDWSDTLAGRAAQLADLDDATSQTVISAEQRSLPFLRDALLLDLAAAAGKVGGPQPSTTDAGNAMTDRFGVDMLSSGTLQTTRLAQATAALQNLLELVRSGDVGSDSVAHGWVLQPPAADVPSFDTAWGVTGDYTSWRQAVTAFLFPEQHLDPAQLVPARSPQEHHSADFAALAEAVRHLDLTPAGAVDAMGAYAAAVGGHSGLPEGVTLHWLSDRDAIWQQQLELASASVPAPADDTTPWAREIYWAAPMLVAQRLQASGQFQAALDWLWTVLPINTTNPVSAWSRVNSELNDEPTRPSLQFDRTWTARLRPFALVEGRPAPYLRATLLSTAECLLDYADAEFSAGGEDSLAHARSLYQSALGLLRHPRLAPVPAADDSPGEASFPLPLVETLTTRAVNELTKLRQGRNIAGLPRRSITLAAEARTERQPTPYHFATLLSRAQQLAQQAIQMEATYLALLEKYDSKTLQWQQAGQALSVASMQQQVSSDQLQYANDGKAAADAQVVKAAQVISGYQQAIAAPPNKYEQQLLKQYGQMRDLQDVLATTETAVGVAQAATAGTSGALFSFGGSVGNALLQAAATVARGDAQMAVTNLQAVTQASQLMSNVEERRQGWQRELATAQQDGAIAAKQQQVAADQVVIAQAQLDVAQQQSANAAATLALLQGQFTSPDLYKVMNENVGAAYRMILQMATAIARLAQDQLAFERAETAREFIDDDYWQTPGALLVSGRDTSRGMTGAERLTADLDQLDGFAFSTDTRLLNVSQTFSLAAMLPVDFLSFRSSGLLQFATPLSWFTTSFPDQYRCLIQHVSVSVVALVPPSRGIRAVLRNYGVSRVVMKQAEGGFSDLVIRRDPNEIAFTSAVSATGVFASDSQSALLGPFEGIGVDTSWSLELPPAANPFDFGGIADVLLTVDYTALPDPGYATQVVRALNADRRRGADVAFSLARDYPDLWYALCNTDPSHDGPSVTLTVRDIDLPPWVTDLRTANVAVQVVAAGALPPITATLTRPAEATTLGGGALLSVDGLASTRRSAAAWAPLVGTPPAGSWALAFDKAFAQAVSDGAVQDVVLLLSWTGRAPAWNE